MLLFAYLILYFFLVFVIRSLLLWEKIGINPLTFNKTDDAHGFNGKVFTVITFMEIIVVGIYAFKNNWYDYLLPFLSEAMKLRDNPGYEKRVCRKPVVTAANIRKDINEIEFHCVYYAKDIEKQFNEYFSEENKHLKELKKLKKAIDKKLNE